MNPMSTRRIVPRIMLSWLAIAIFASPFAVANDKLKVGERLPEFSLPRADSPGRSFTSQQLLGKPAALIFWRPNQELSAAALTDLQNIVREVGRGRLHVAAVDTALTPAQDAVAFMDKMELTFPVLLDPNRDLYGKVGIIVSPTTMLFDAGGVLRFSIPTRPPQYPQVVRAHLRFLVGDIDEAQRNKEVNPTVLTIEHDRAAAWRMYNLGKKAQDGGDARKARELFERSLAQYPALVESRCALGFLELAAGEWGTAGNDFESALAQQPSLAKAQLGRAAVLGRTGSDAEAERILLSLLDRESIAVRTRYELGRIYDARGELDKASTYYRDALSIMFPEDQR